MLTSAALGWAILGTQQVPTAVPPRWSMGVRLKRMDAAFMKPENAGRRAAAVPLVNSAVLAFFGGQTERASRALDEATAAIEGRAWRPGDALDVYVTPRIAEPGTKGLAILRFAYPVTEGAQIVVRVDGAQETVTLGGETREWRKEIQGSIEVAFGDWTWRESVLMERGLEATLAGTNPELAGMRWLVQNQMTLETEPDWGAMLGRARQIRAAEGVVDAPKEIPMEVPLAIYEGTMLRMVRGATLPERPTVVVALHGAGGSENLFFEGYGAGVCARLAKERNWIFVAPRVTAGAYANALAWLRSAYGIEPGRVFVMGHSAGGAAALQTGAAGRTPDGLVLFAPAGRTVPENLKGVPTFLAVGQQELGMLRQGALTMEEANRGRRDFEFFDVPNCEHLLVVGLAAERAYSFLDRLGE